MVSHHVTVKSGDNPTTSMLSLNYSSREHIGGTDVLKNFASRYLQQLDYDSLSCDVLPDSHVTSHDVM